MLSVIAPPGSLTAAIAARIAGTMPLSAPAAIVAAMPPVRLAPLGDLEDADFAAGCITPLADLAATLAALLPDHRSIVLIGLSAGLGDWDAVVAGAYAAGAVGLMRSAALEYAQAGVAINFLALPSDDPALAESAAPMAGALLASGAASGQVIFCDGGANLRMRAARPRQAALPTAPPPA